MGTLGTIVTIKEQPQTSQPLMLAEIAMPDGVTVIRLSTHDLTAPAFRYGGNSYLPRILTQDMAAFQIVSQQGISIPPTVSLKLADADKLLWGYEQSIGFRGATLRIRFVFFQAGTLTPAFSTDWILYGPFLCSAASNVDDTSLTLPAGSKLNMEQIFAPFIHIQQTCPWSFPATAAQRASGASNQQSDYYQCGYSPDVATGSGGCGNFQSGSTPYTSCGYSKGDCVNRGMYTSDSSNRKSGRFGGMQFQPPTALKSRSYVTGNWQEVYNNLNESKYGDFVPMLYGPQWVDCPVIVSTGDANMAKFEALVCYGQVQNISMVVLNDTLIPCAVGTDGTNYPVSDVSFCWRTINNGKRSGAPNMDTLFNGLGDPYGSYCVIEVVVPNALATSSAAPRIRALTQGPLVQIFSGVTGVSFDGTYAYVTITGSVPPLTVNQPIQFTISGTGVSGLDTTWNAPLLDWNYVGGAWILRFPCTLSGGPYSGLSGLIQYPANTTRPPWILLDLLLWAGWNVSDINIASFIAADAVCGVQVSYQDQNGNTLTKDRYKYQNVLRQRRSMAQVTHGVLGSMNAIAVPNAGGALTLIVKQTLADQQPTLPLGSNYPTPIASVHGAGGAGTGYAAYSFNESDIIRDDEGRGKPKFTITQRPNPDLPALASVNWQDEDNTYVVDSLTLADLPALQRVSQNTTAAAPADGFANYDQVRRIINTWFAENAWGNPRGDPGGTLQVQMTTTFKSVDLQVGQIVLLSWRQDNLSLQPFRILQLKPSTNFETCDLLLQWHNDAWYQDSYGQQITPGANGASAMLPARAPYPVFTGGSHYGATADPLHPYSKPNYSLISDTNWQGQATQIKVFRIAGVPPINTFSQLTRAPYVPLQGTPASTGGAIAGGTPIWIGFAAEDSAGQLTPLSNLVSVYVPAGTNTNTATVAGIQWATGTVAYHAWTGTDPQRLYYVGRTASTPSSVTFALALNQQVNGDTSAPDQCLAGLEVDFKRVMIPGVWTGLATACTSTTIQFTGAAWTTNQWAGRVVSLVGLKSGSTGAENPPGTSWLIASNTSNTLTLSASYGPAPTSIFNPSNGDLAQLVIRAQATSATSSSITDTGLALTAGAEVGRVVRIIAGTGAGQFAMIQASTATALTIQGAWGLTPDTTSVFWIEEAAWLGTQDIDLGSISNPFAAATQYAIQLGYPEQYLLICPYGLKSDGTTSLDTPQSMAIRDFYLFDQTQTDTNAGTGTVGAASQVSGLAALNSGAYTNGIAYSMGAGGVLCVSVGVTWTASTDPNWASEEILFNNGSVLMPLGSAGGNTFTSTPFPAPANGNYTVEAVSVNKAGVMNLTSPPTVTVTVNSALDVPLAPTAMALARTIEGITTFPVVTNALTASGSAVLNFASTIGIAQGQIVSGAGVATGSVVVSVTSTTVTLNQNTAGVANGATVTFTAPGIGAFNVLQQTVYYQALATFATDPMRNDASLLFSNWDYKFQTFTPGPVSQGYIASGTWAGWGVFGLAGAAGVNNLTIIPPPQPLGVAQIFLAFAVVPSNCAGAYVTTESMPSSTAAFGASSFSYAIVGVSLSTGVVVASYGAPFATGSSMVGKTYLLNGFPVVVASVQSATQLTLAAVPTSAELSALSGNIPFQDIGLITLLAYPTPSRIVKANSIVAGSITNNEIAPQTILGSNIAPSFADNSTTQIVNNILSVKTVPVSQITGSGYAEFTGVAGLAGTDGSYVSFPGAGIAVSGPGGTQQVIVTSSSVIMRSNGTTGPTAYLSTSGLMLAQAWNYVNACPNGPAMVLTATSLILADSWNSSGTPTSCYLQASSSGILITDTAGNQLAVSSGQVKMVDSTGVTSLTLVTDGLVLQSAGSTGPTVALLAIGLYIASGWNTTGSGYPVGPAASLTASALTLAASWNSSGAATGPYTQVNASGVTIASSSTGPSTSITSAGVTIAFGTATGNPTITVGATALSISTYNDSLARTIALSTTGISIASSSVSGSPWAITLLEPSSDVYGMYWVRGSVGGRASIFFEESGVGAPDMTVGYSPIGSFSRGVLLQGSVLWGNSGTAASGAGTLTNLPTGKSGNPVWLPVYDSAGTLRYLPAW